MSAPRGFLLIAGPDGAGKSTVADAIEDRARSLDAHVTRVHYRPGVLRPGGTTAGQVTHPHGQRPWNPPLAVVKLLAILADFLLAAPRWRRRAEDGLLIVERGWWDMAVDPHRYRLPRWTTPAIRLLGRFTPEADVVVMLSGDPDVLADRKNEIAARETARQIHAWQELVGSAGRRQVTVDTTQTTPEEVAEQTLSELDRVDPVWRHVPFAAARLDLRAAGQATAAFTVHRSFAPLARAGAVVGRMLYRLGATRRCPPPVPELRHLLDELDIEADGLVAFRSSARGRWVVGVASAGTLEAVAKIGQGDDDALRNEAEVLGRLHGHTKAFDVPHVRLSHRWRDRFVVLTDAASPRDREPSVDDVAGIATELTGGVDGIGPMVHGDLAPWNIHRVRETDRLVVIDWEDARAEYAPLHDLAHFVVRTGGLLRRWTPEQATAALTAAVSPGARHLLALGISADQAPVLLMRYLDRTTPSSGEESRYRRRVREIAEKPCSHSPDDDGRLLQGS